MASVPFPKYIIPPQSLKKGEVQVVTKCTCICSRKNEHCALTFSAKKNNNKKSKKDLLQNSQNKKKSLKFFLEKTKLILKWYCWVVLLHNNN
jgi:hypothetical protein